VQWLKLLLEDSGSRVEGTPILAPLCFDILVLWRGKTSKTAFAFLSEADNFEIERVDPEV